MPIVIEEPITRDGEMLALKETYGIKVSQMKNDEGRGIPNQFIIDGPEFEIFQSYDSIIAKKVWRDGKEIVYLDRDSWDYSTTTGKYRNRFLGENKAETLKKIKDGTYKLINLNQA